MAAAEEHFGHQFCHWDNVDKDLNDEYDLELKVIGEGSYGMVKIAKMKLTGAVRAVKSIYKDSVPDYSRFKDEVECQASLDHPNIVKLFEVFTDARTVHLVMELCEGGELFERIITQTDEEGGGFGERDAADYMQQMLGAVSYLHTRDIAHRDIKPENFLMQDKSAKAQLKLIDFGLAKKTNGKPMTTKAGTPYYVAPEVLSGSYDHTVDIWSCGVICYILLSGAPPFSGDDDPEILRNVKKQTLEFPEDDFEDTSDAAKDFIRAMIERKPARRKTAHELLEDKWIKDKASVATGTVAKDVGDKLAAFTRTTKMKKVTLSIIAQQVKDSDIKELRATFERMDENRDGTLSFDEIKAGMEAASIETPPNFDAILKRLDTDGSGCIDYTEFMAATLSYKMYLKKDVLWQAFLRFDENRDSKISREELKKLLSDESDAFIDDMLREVDLDGSGEIDWTEFVKMMEQGSGAVVGT